MAQLVETLGIIDPIDSKSQYNTGGWKCIVVSDRRVWAFIEDQAT